MFPAYNQDWQDRNRQEARRREIERLKNDPSVIDDSALWANRPQSRGIRRLPAGKGRPIYNPNSNQWYDHSMAEKNAAMLSDRTLPQGGPYQSGPRRGPERQSMGWVRPRNQKQQDRGFSTPSQGPVPFIPSGNVYSGAGVYKPGQSGAAGRFFGGFDPSGHQGASGYLDNRYRPMGPFSAKSRRGPWGTYSSDSESNRPGGKGMWAPGGNARPGTTMSGAGGGWYGSKDRMQGYQRDRYRSNPGSIGPSQKSGWIRQRPPWAPAPWNSNARRGRGRVGTGLAGGRRRSSRLPGNRGYGIDNRPGFYNPTSGARMQGGGWAPARGRSWGDHWGQRRRRRRPPIGGGWNRPKPPFPGGGGGDMPGFPGGGGGWGGNPNPPPAVPGNNPVIPGPNPGVLPPPITGPVAGGGQPGFDWRRRGAGRGGYQDIAFKKKFDAHEAKYGRGSWDRWKSDPSKSKYWKGMPSWITNSIAWGEGTAAPTWQDMGYKDKASFDKRWKLGKDGRSLVHANDMARPFLDVGYGTWWRGRDYVPVSRGPDTPTGTPTPRPTPRPNPPTSKPISGRINTPSRRIPNARRSRRPWYRDSRNRATRKKPTLRGRRTPSRSRSRRATSSVPQRRRSSFYGSRI